MKTFEYAVLRAVPRVERGELANVGVIVYSQEHDFLAASVHVDAVRLRALDAEVDVESVCAAVEAVQAVCEGRGPAAAGTKGERFRWLTAPRSTIVQPGPVHAGITDSPQAELEHLLERLVR